MSGLHPSLVGVAGSMVTAFVYQIRRVLIPGIPPGFRGFI